MGITERVDELLSTSPGQTVGWFLILGVELGVFTRTGPDLTILVSILALGASWILGASYGRRQGYERAAEESRSEGQVE